MNFLAKVEDKFKLSRADKQKNIKDNFIRMSLIAGFQCRNLAVNTLAEKLNLKPTVIVGWHAARLSLAFHHSVDALTSRIQILTPSRLSLHPVYTLAGGLGPT